MEVQAAIQQIFLEHRRRYGYRRITAELRRRGIPINHKRVARIMRKDNLLGIHPKRFVITTNSNHKLEIYPNLAGRMTLNGIIPFWVADNHLHPFESGIHLSGGDSHASAATRDRAESVNGGDVTEYEIDTSRDMPPEAALIKVVLGAPGFVKGAAWLTRRGCPVKFVLDVEQHTQNLALTAC